MTSAAIMISIWAWAVGVGVTARIIVPRVVRRLAAESSARANPGPGEAYRLVEAAAHRALAIGAAWPLAVPYLAARWLRPKLLGRLHAAAWQAVPGLNWVPDLRTVTSATVSYGLRTDPAPGWLFYCRRHHSTTQGSDPVPRGCHWCRVEAQHDGPGRVRRRQTERDRRPVVWDVVGTVAHHAGGGGGSSFGNVVAVGGMSPAEISGFLELAVRQIAASHGIAPHQIGPAQISWQWQPPDDADGGWQYFTGREPS